MFERLGNMLTCGCQWRTQEFQRKANKLEVKICKWQVVCNCVLRTRGQNKNNENIYKESREADKGSVEGR